MKEKLKHIRTLLSNVKKALKFAIYQNDTNTVEFPGEIPVVGDEVVAYDASGNKIENFTQDIVVKVGDVEYHVKIVDNIVKEVVEKPIQTETQAENQSQQTETQMNDELVKKLEDRIKNISEMIEKRFKEVEAKFSAFVKTNEEILKIIEMSAPATTKKEEADANNKILELRKKLFN